MRTKNYVDILLENGIHFNTISKMGKNQVRLLAERVSKSKSNEKCACGCDKDTCPCGPECKKCDCGKKKKKKKETKEATTKIVYNPSNPADAAEIAKMVSKANPNATIETPKETTESQELGERFKSKAQQKLFFMKCGDGKTKEQKKWCKLRDEFARDTTERDYEDMPKKLHPEKTVGYKKKRKSVKESNLEKIVFKMVEDSVPPGMTKGSLLKLIQEKKNTKFIQKAEKEIEKKGTEHSFSNWCKKEGLDDDGKVTKKCIEAGLKSDDSKIVKKANFANNIGGFTGAKHKKRKETTESFMLKNPKKVTMFSEEEGVEMKRPIGRLTSLGEDTETKPAPPKTKPGTKPGKGNPFKRPNTNPKEKPRAGKTKDNSEKQKSDFMLVIKQILNIS